MNNRTTEMKHVLRSSRVHTHLF